MARIIAMLMLAVLLAGCGGKGSSTTNARSLAPEMGALCADLQAFETSYTQEGGQELWQNWKDSMTLLRSDMTSVHGQAALDAGTLVSSIETKAFHISLGPGALKDMQEARQELLSEVNAYQTSYC